MLIQLLLVGIVLVHRSWSTILRVLSDVHVHVVDVRELLDRLALLKALLIRVESAASTAATAIDEAATPIAHAAPALELRALAVLRLAVVRRGDRGLVAQRVRVERRLRERDRDGRNALGVLDLIKSLDGGMVNFFNFSRSDFSHLVQREALLENLSD